MFRRKRPKLGSPDYYDVVMDDLGLTMHQIDKLATYNAEVGRGLMHTDRYKHEMRVLQNRFNAANGYIN